MKFNGTEKAEVHAHAKVTRASGEVERVEAERTPETIKFEPFGCLCGGVWLMIENNTPRSCPYCGEAVLTEEG